MGMGIIPLCFKPGEDADTLGLTGHERYTIDLPSHVNEIRPGQDVTVVTDSGKTFVSTLRFDTEVIFELSSLLVVVSCLFCCALLLIHHIFLFPSDVLVISLQVELAYFDHGGILQYVIRNLINAKQ